MIRINLIILFSLYQVCSFAQADIFSYQLALRGADGNSPLLGTNIALRISILDGSATGGQLYREIHNQALTNNAGIVNIQVGNGSAKEGDIATINWTTTRFIKTEVDLAGGSNFTDMGATQILGVPFAIQAKRATAADNAISATSASGLSIAGTGEDYLKHNGTVWIAEKFPFTKSADSTLQSNSNINRFRYQDNNSSSYIELQKKYSNSPYIDVGGKSYYRGYLNVVSNHPNHQSTGIIGGNKHGVGILGFSIHGTGVYADSDSGIALSAYSFRNTGAEIISENSLALNVIGYLGARISSFDTTALELDGQLKVNSSSPNKQFAYQIAFQPASFNTVALTHVKQKITDIISVTPIYNGINNTIPGYYVHWNPGTNTWSIHAAADDGTPSQFPGGCGFNILVIRR